MLGDVGSVGVQLGQPPWRWLIPVGVLLLCALGLLVAALVYPVPGGVNGCEGPHIPASIRNDYALADPWLRDWSHAKHVRHQLWDGAFLVALPALALSAFGGFGRRHRWVKVEFGLSVLCVVVILLSAQVVDPVYFGGGC
jgi:hypothetical protein